MVALLAGIAAQAATISLTGVSNGQTYTNPASISMTASVTGVTSFENNLSIYDGPKLLFVRPFNSNNGPNYSMNFTWMEPPLGNHALRAVWVDGDAFPPVTNQTAVINVSVVGSGFGFYGLSNLVTAPTNLAINAPTLLGCQLIVSNRSTSASGPLRVRFFTSQTYNYQSLAGPFLPTVIGFTEYVQGPVLTSGSLASNATATFTLLTNQNVICPASTNPDFDEDFHGQTNAQFHVFAVLEEQVGIKWAQIDRAKIFSSLPLRLFPYNDGAIGIEPLPNTNTFAYLTSLVIAGPTNILEGTTTNLLAVAALSDGATGSVNAAWSASPISIGTTGTITAPLVSMDTPVTVTASFVRKTTRTAMRTVTIKNAVAPPVIIAHPTNKFVAIGSNTTFSVTATGDALAYQWRRNNANIVNATNSTVTITNAQIFTNGTYTVVITNSALSLTSNPALLTVVARPGFSSPQRLADQTFRFTLSSTVGSVCTVEHSTNLTSWAVLSNVTVVASPFTLTDFGASNLSRRFYRARVGP